MSQKEYRSYTVKFFDRWARVYDPFMALFRLGRVRREAVRISGAGRRDKVLDVCTGTGAQAFEFARRCHDVTGVDLSAGMLAVARKKSKDGGVHFVRMDATKLGFGDDAFDVSSISFGLHDMPPEVREQVLREMGRVTKGGIVVIDYKPPQNRFLRALLATLLAPSESKYFPEFMRTDFQALLARCGLQAAEEMALWLGVLRVCLCRRA